MAIRGTTRILGIFGDPVAHSLSPLMQNAALEQAGIDAVYVPFHVRSEDLPKAVAAIRSLDLLGVNVTVPHKEQVVSLLDEIDPPARLIGAVNTIVNRGGVLTGYNTDGLGLLRSLDEDLQFDPAGRRILLIGAGGACRAAIAALGQAGAEWIGIANRTPARAVALAAEFSEALRGGTTLAGFDLGSAEQLADLFPRTDLLINTSALGLKGESPDLPLHLLPRGACLYDMVYRREGTPLLRAAQARGHRTADGLGMLAAQGEEAFYHWTGVRPPAGLMKARLLAECNKNPVA